MVEIDRFEKVQTLMYTQCPECSTAFRVTAEVLKQAAGKVRCGGCGHAFNALEFLSETMPEQPTKVAAEEALPELKPEPLQNDSGVPKSISAEQSAALLKTLDELAGSDIRIEDTGVEWRVLDEDELGEAADDPVANADDAAPPVEKLSEVDEFLEESPTPVDQFLTDTPAQVESPEIFEAEANEPAMTPVDELRFDDNTPLPEDFEDNFVGAAYSADHPERPATEPTEPDAASEAVDESAAADLDLSDPHEWTDILDEFEDLAEAVAAPFDEEARTGLDDIQDADQQDEPGDAETAVAGEQPLDMDAQFALQAEAMGIDLSGTHAAVEEPEPENDIDIDELLREGSIDDRELEDLLDEDLVDEVDEEDPDEATQLDFIGEDIDADIEDATEIARDEDEEFDEEPEESEDDEGDLVEDLDDRDDALDLLYELDDELDETLSGIDEEADEAPKDLEPEGLEPEGLEPEDQEPEVLEPGDDDGEDWQLEDDTDDSFDHDEIYVPPMTEEEQTINMQIDQDLMALAIEDDEGLTSTMVLPEDAADIKADDRKHDTTDKEQALMDTSAGFETIIMEGEFVRTALDKEKLAADAAAAADALANAAAAERAAEKAARAGKRRWGLVVLFVLLGLQVLHQSRETLATIPAFNNVVGPMYRAIGKPLSPEWDITGWRFEATKGSTDEGDENLTIYSRIGNKSDKPLPYPLVAISLTDRFEETVGSRILDPADYLSNDLDPRKLVQPGNTFDAVITIQSPAETATGFKLNVCYRESGGQLRCAIDDFK
jgi:predicted Zn finger-like uncharacterized protein